MGGGLVQRHKRIQVEKTKEHKHSHNLDQNLDNAFKDFFDTLFSYCEMAKIPTEPEKNGKVVSLRRGTSTFMEF